MDKTLIGAAGALLTTWMGLLTGTKVDKTACEATHKGVCEKLDMIIKHQDEYGESINYIRDRLDKHIDSSKNALVM